MNSFGEHTIPSMLSTATVTGVTVGVVVGVDNHCLRWRGMI